MRVYTGDNGMGLALRPPTGLPQARTRIYRGANRSRGVGQATAPGGCLLEDAPLGCSPSGVPWQASGGGPANNWVYYDSITGQPLNLDDACYINDNLLVNCADTGDFGPQGSPQPAGPITILAQTPEYAAAVAAANAAYVPPPPPPPTQINPNASTPKLLGRATQQPVGPGTVSSVDTACNRDGGKPRGAGKRDRTRDRGEWHAHRWSGHGNMQRDWGGAVHWTVGRGDVGVDCGGGVGVVDGDGDEEMNMYLGQASTPVAVVRARHCARAHTRPCIGFCFTGGCCGHGLLGLPAIPRNCRQ